MDDLTITLPEPLRRYVEERVSEGGFDTASDYFRELIQREQAIRRLDALLIEGLDSGEPEEADDAWWAERHAELDRRIARES